MSLHCKLYNIQEYWLLSADLEFLYFKNRLFLQNEKFTDNILNCVLLKLDRFWGWIFMQNQKFPLQAAAKSNCIYSEIQLFR